MKKFIISGKTVQVRVEEAHTEPHLAQGEKVLASVDPADWQPLAYIERNDNALILMAKLIMQGREEAHQQGHRSRSRMEAPLPYDDRFE